ncbi:hypothetical protein [Williamsia maris]|uniref:Uncharacterized protein n=1 Tax=Williamsia maris TaxID=72806 RepID=A0ABT1HJB5_9NOCA|nr:hypothetical protein [Williamsia maris]MCP2178014.1 hypothetical protein [Williamsia maris]
MIVQRIRTTTAAALIAAGLGTAALTTGAGTAAAADVHSTPTGGVQVWLTHTETVAAAHSGLANYLQASGISNRVAVYLRNDSRYISTRHTIPGRPGLFVDTRYQQVVTETANHPDGRIGINITPARPNLPVVIAQYWR